MRLIDCTYLNSPGGNKILEILLDKISSNELKNFNFIIDFRADITTLNKLKNTQYKLIKNSELKRRAYYHSIKNKIEKCICLANVPPPIKLKCDVIIYFHNDLLLKPKLSQSFLKSISFFIKKTYIKMINSKKYKWAVQTNLMREKLSNEFLIKNEMINVLPIFRDFTEKKSLKKISNSFLYVCSSAPHKNLKRLINAFNLIQNIKDFNLSLHLTLDNKEYFHNEIFLKNRNPRLKIINHGMLSSRELESLYSESEFLIFPSLIESFGLPLIESVGFNCKVIAADLPYVDEVITPSIKFNPYSSKSIANAIDKAILSQNIPYSKLIIKNKINKFINLINK